MPTKKNKDITRIVDRVNKSSADFVNRLKDPNRLTIPDWEDSRYIATHKLGVGTDDNGQIFIFPYVQNIDGKLIDFSNPKFGKWDGMDSAIERKDTVHVDSIQDGLDFTENYKRYYPKGKTFKCGGRRKAQLGLDIREGGIAIPIAPNMYYMNGRSHDEGGIAIGPNNKNGLEVEGGEVVKVGKNNVKVFSSVPLLRGASPAELVMGGANPNKVFKAQEDFKDRNRINDDGTTYEMGGDKVIHINNLPSSFRGQLRNGRYVQIGVPPVTSKAKSWNTTFKDHVNSLNVEMKDFIMDGINYGKKLLPKPLKKYYSRAINILNSPGVQDINNTAQKITQVTSMFDEKKAGGIYIKPSKRGTFTAAATKHGMGVQEFASKVLANKEDYSPAMVKKANFIRNASHWKKEYGGEGNVLPEIVVTPTGNYDKIYDATGINKRKKIAKDILQILPFSGFVSDVIDAITPNGISEPLSIGGAASSASAYGLTKAKVPFYSIPSLAFKTALGSPDTINDIYTLYNDIKTPKEEFNKNKKEYGGSMLYTINGNVKNGLSLRPKAEWGKGKDENRWKYKTDPENFVRGYYQITPYGRIDSDGESYIVVNGKNVYNTFPNFMDEAIKYQSNKRPQFYAEKRMPMFGEKSLAEKFGLARGGWSYGEASTIDYVPDINISVPVDYASDKVKSNKASSKSTTPASASTVEQPAVVRRDEYYSSPRVEGPATSVDEAYAARQARGAQAVTEYKTDTNNTIDNKNNDTEGKWIGQYKTTNAGDWIGLGSNILGSILSYGLTSSAINKTPMPSRPAVMQAGTLKKTHNIEPQLSEIREAEQMNRAAVRRNTASSNTSLAREQRLLNEAIGARAALHGQKETIETRLINQDRLNRQQVAAQNTALYNDYLNRVVGTKQAQNQYRISNVNNLLSGLTGSVNNILGTIESRRATNNTLRAMAAANPNVDARLIGGFDYYIDPVTKKMYNKNQQYVRTING